MSMEPSNVRKKVREPSKKRTIIYDVGTAQYENGIVKYEKKVREPPNVRKKLSHMMLELHNVKMKPSNVRKQK